MAVAGTGNVLGGRAILHGNAALVDQLACRAQCAWRVLGVLGVLGVYGCRRLANSLFTHSLPTLFTHPRWGP